MRAPLRAKASAVARPMPLEAPVTTARTGLKSCGIHRSELVRTARGNQENDRLSCSVPPLSNHLPWAKITRVGDSSINRDTDRSTARPPRCSSIRK